MNERPRQHDDGRGRHTTHAPFQLSDSDMSEEDYSLADIYDGWGFDQDPEDGEYDDDE